MKSRAERNKNLFANQNFDIVRRVQAPEGDTITPSIGRGIRSGYVVRNTLTGEELIVSKATLKTMANEFQAVTLPGSMKPRNRKASGPIDQGSVPTDETPVGTVYGDDQVNHDDQY